MRSKPLLFVVAAALGCGGASAGGRAATTPAAAVDVSPVKDRLRVYQDDGGHVVALVEPDPEIPTPPELTLFWKDGAVFHAVPVTSATADGLKFEIDFNDPRIPSSPAGEVKREGGKTHLSCWGKELPLTKVPADQARGILDGARFAGGRVDFSPVALGKDGERYLYIDSAYLKGNHVYRVFEGKKGDMRAVDVVEGKWDERSNVLTVKTKEGNVVVRRDENEKTEYTLKPGWEGKKGDFTALPRAASWRLIYEQLGVYPSRPPPSPCDLALP